METVKGLKVYIKILKQIPKEMEEGVEAVLAANASEIEFEAKIMAPVDTGKLRQSIKASKVKDLTWKIRSNSTGLAPYDIFVEYGTRFMKSQPFLFPAFFKQRKQVIRDLKKLIGKTLDK